MKQHYKMIRSLLKANKVPYQSIANVGIVTTGNTGAEENYTFEIDKDAVLICTALLKHRASSKKIRKMIEFANLLNGHLKLVRVFVNPVDGEIKLGHSSHFEKGNLTLEIAKECWYALDWAVHLYDEAFSNVLTGLSTPAEEIETMIELLETGFGQR